MYNLSKHEQVLERNRALSREYDCLLRRKIHRDIFKQHAQEVRRKRVDSFVSGLTGQKDFKVRDQHFQVWQKPWYNRDFIKDKNFKTKEPLESSSIYEPWELQYFKQNDRKTEKVLEELSLESERRRSQVMSIEPFKTRRQSFRTRQKAKELQLRLPILKPESRVLRQQRSRLGVGYRESNATKRQTAMKMYCHSALQQYVLRGTGQSREVLQQSAIIRKKDLSNLYSDHP